jgi:serine protease AprX
VLFVFGFAPAAFAAGQHSHHASKAKPGVPGRSAQHQKLDRELTFRADHKNPNDTTSVIITLTPGASLPAEFKKFARAGKLNLINAHVVDLPNRLLKQVAAHPAVFDVHYNRPIFKHNFRTSLTVGALAAQRAYGMTGAGVGVAVIDSGITAWHPDLMNRSTASYPYGDQRVSKFIDVVNGQGLPYDDNGHGTHVSGIIAGNGHDSKGQKSGVAPDASIVSLKVLDANGLGTIGNIIQALDWVVANRTTYNIRVVNLSVGAGIHESYWTDPLTLAAKRAVDAGVVVVTAAGNIGRNSAGQTQYGGITAPGNAPWVLTVGAYSTQGTPGRGDDVIAGYSSRGPTAVDYAAKPDLVAPGTGTMSLATPGSTFYSTKTAFLVPGLVPTAFVPYLSLSGTSMAAPVVSGTVALMLQANPSLTPNAVKAILMYTAQHHAGYNALTEGAGFLNTVGAVRLAQFYATAQPGQRVPVQKMWSKYVLWGNHKVTGGLLRPTANAYRLGVVWGAGQTPQGENVVWGSECGDATCDNVLWGSDPVPGAVDNIVWGSSCADATCDNMVWGSSNTNAQGDEDDNIVWGSDCGGADCDQVVWGSNVDDPTVTGDPTLTGDNVVWGSSLDGDPSIDLFNVLDNVVWGSSVDDPTVTGDPAATGDNVVWGSTTLDEIVFSDAPPDDNIVWGSDCDPDQGGCDNVVWGSDADGTVVYGDVTATGTITQVQLGQLTDGQLLKLMVKLAVAPPIQSVTTTTSPPTTTTDLLLHLTTTTTVTTTVTTATDWLTGVKTTTTQVTTTTVTTDTWTHLSTTASSTATTTTVGGGI